MSCPPKELDGAKVLEWAWSGEQPFGVLRYSSGELAYEIYGLAICQYEGSNQFYQFSCTADWEVEQDFPYDSVAEAKAHLPEQYKGVRVHWQRYE